MIRCICFCIYFVPWREEGKARSLTKNKDEYAMYLFCICFWSQLTWYGIWPKGKKTIVLAENTLKIRLRWQDSTQSIKLINISVLKSRPKGPKQNKSEICLSARGFRKWTSFFVSPLTAGHEQILKWACANFSWGMCKFCSFPSIIVALVLILLFQTSSSQKS